MRLKATRNCGKHYWTTIPFTPNYIPWTMVLKFSWHSFSHLGARQVAFFREISIPNYRHLRILSCNAENAANNLHPLEFTELVRTALAQRGLSDALPTDSSVFYGEGHGGGRGGNRGGCGGGQVGARKELKLDGESVCHAWNNQKSQWNSYSRWL